MLRWQQLEKSLQSPAGQPQRPLRLLIDGRFTNRQLFKSLSSGTTVIGRIRSDAKLYHPAPQGQTGGRRKRYGDRAPTSEQLRQDDNTPWQTIEVFAAGARHRCRVKTLSPLLWQSSGYERPLRLVVIAPLSYRPRKGSRLLYRQPAFLICSDPQLDLTQIMLAERQKILRLLVKEVLVDSETVTIRHSIPVPQCGPPSGRSPSANSEPSGSIAPSYLLRSGSHLAVAQ